MVQVKALIMRAHAWMLRPVTFKTAYAFVVFVMVCEAIEDLRDWWFQ